jgi:hypothetical protein
MRDWMRSAARRVVEIARASRVKGEKGKDKLRPAYRKLWTLREDRQAKRFSSEIGSGVKRSPIL